MNVRFRPWVGENYQSGFLGAKVLVLGESHYQWKDADNIDDRPEITIQLVREQIEGGYTKAFWTNIACCFLNHTPSLGEKREFWHRVAFYNFVQRSVGNASRIAPSADAWLNSAVPFFEVLRELRPDFILVLGYRLRGNLPNDSIRSGPRVEGAPKPETFVYDFANVRATAFGIRHPSSGFNGRFWNPHVLKALNLATNNPLPP